MFTGTLAAIFVAPAAGEPMQELAQIEAIAACGLAGDRYALNVARHDRGYTKIRHVTLLEEETVEALRRDHELDLAPVAFRRNLLTRGVPLTHLIGRRFRIGEVTLEGTELSEPCQYLADLLGKAVVKPLVHRAGIRAAIVHGGALHVGDPIAAVDG
jgi:MOSC domain-containing protein YiiM